MFFIQQSHIRANRTSLWEFIYGVLLLIGKELFYCCKGNCVYVEYLTKLGLIFLSFTLLPSSFKGIPCNMLSVGLSINNNQ